MQYFPLNLSEMWALKGLEQKFWFGNEKGSNEDENGAKKDEKGKKRIGKERRGKESKNDKNNNKVKIEIIIN